MKIDFELTKQDYLDFNMFHLGHSSTIKRSVFMQRYIVSIMYLIMPFVLAQISEIPFIFWGIPSLIVYISWIVFYPKYLKWHVNKTISKMINEGKNAMLLGNHSITLTENGLVETSHLSETKTNWEVIEEVLETEKHIFIYNSAVSAYIIPVSAFKDTNEKEAFMNTLHGYIENKTV